MDDIIHAKIYRLMNKVLEPNFDLTEQQLHMVLQHLAKTCPDYTTEEFFITWLRKAIDVSLSENQRSTNKLLFICATTGLMCTKEELFMNLGFTGLLDEFFKIFSNYPESEKSPCIQCSYIDLITCCLKHKSGTRWIIATNLWYDIYIIICQTVHERVFKGGTTFLLDLMNKSKTDNKPFYNNLIKLLLTPLFSLSKCSSNISMETESIEKIPIKRLYLLECIIYETLIRSCSNNNYSFIGSLQRKFKIEDILQDLGKKYKSKLSLQLNKLLSLVIYFVAAMELKTISPVDKVSKLNTFIGKICGTLINISNSTDGYSDMLELIHTNHLYFKAVVKDSPWADFLTEEFEHQTLIFLFNPITDVCEEVGIGSVHGESDDVIREMYMTSCIRKCLPIVFHLNNKIKKKYSIEDVIVTMRHVQQFSKHFELKWVHTMAQAIMYVLRDSLNFFRKTENVSLEVQELIVVFVETIIYLLTEFDISWKDNIESIYVGYTFMDLLTLPNISNKLTTRSLQLFNVAIRKNLSPELVLLLDEEDGYEEQFIEIYKKTVNHDYWEVRNASVQVMHAASQTKQDFQTVTKLIITQNYPEKMLEMAVTDPEIIVRISAFRCFHDTVRAGMCENLLKSDKFYDDMLQALKTEVNGTIRSEYITLISVIYEHQEVGENMIEQFYETMTSAVLGDDCSAVKTNALGFWQKVIDKHLCNVGVIDGEFPTVTFSKEKKKIITFDESAIKQCLQKLLYKLSEIGCLSSFLFALNFYVDQRVIEVATNLIKPFVELLRKHYCKSVPEEQLLITSSNSVVSDDNSSPVSNQNDESSSSSSFSIAPSPYPESLYEDILNLQDMIPETELFQESNLSDLISIQINEFLLYIDTFNRSEYNTSQQKGESLEDLDLLLNDILD